MRLAGKVALISGAARGQGAAEARLFVREGAAVIIADILDDAGLQLEAEIRELGGQAAFVHLDVTDADQWANAVTEAVRRYGKLDILVNNAGIGSANVGGVHAPRIHETDAAVWDQIMDVNGKGVFLGTRAAIPALRAAGGGSIINISSIAGLVGLGSGTSSGSAANPGSGSSANPGSGAASNPGSGSGAGAAYASSKGAVRLLTKATAIQYAADGIRCNSVHPGYIDTAMTERMMSDPQIRQQRLAATPLGRIGTVDDIANGVLFLASDESAFMTGSELVIDGGYTAQ